MKARGLVDFAEDFARAELARVSRERSPAAVNHAARTLAAICAASGDMQAARRWARLATNVSDRLMSLAGAQRAAIEAGLGTEAKGLLAEMRRLRRQPRQSGSQGRYAMVEALAWQRKADEARKMAGPLRRSSWWYNATKQALAAALFFDHDFAAVWAKAAVERAVIRDSLRADALFSAVGWGRSRAARDWVATRKGGQQAKLLETIAKAEQWHDLETHARQTEIFLFGARNAAVTSSDPHEMALQILVAGAGSLQATRDGFYNAFDLLRHAVCGKHG